MSKSLFFVNDPNHGICFGCRPYDAKYWSEYGEMKKRVSLKRDLGWREVEHLQNVLAKSDIWDDFPAKGYSLVNVEFKPGDEDQRLDMLYVRDDGALLPCELKIGGQAKDAHGQLIRYLADLQFQQIDLDWVRTAHKRFLGKIDDDAARQIHDKKFTEFVDVNQLSDRFVRILPQTGVLIDEGFPSPCLKAVRYLNGYCGFAIRLIQLDTFVSNGWNADMADYKYRVDFTDVQ